jgi:hypothetical protein
MVERSGMCQCWQLAALCSYGCVRCAECGALYISQRCERSRADGEAPSFHGAVA